LKPRALSTANLNSFKDESGEAYGYAAANKDFKTLPQQFTDEQLEAPYIRGKSSSGQRRSGGDFFKRGQSAHLG